jgi:hypothetical protein
MSCLPSHFSLLAEKTWPSALSLLSELEVALPTSLHQLWSTRLMQKSLGQASLAILLHVFHLLEKYTWRNGIFHKTKNTAAAGTEFISVWIVCYVCAHINAQVSRCRLRPATSTRSEEYKRARVSVLFTSMHELMNRWSNTIHASPILDPVRWKVPQFFIENR